MKPRNKAVHVLTAIAAVLLSILLVPTLCFTAGMSAAVSSATNPDTIHSMITDVVDAIDFERLVAKEAAEYDIAPEELDKRNVVVSLMESDAAEDFFALLVEDIEDYLEGSYDPDDAEVSQQAIVELVQDNMDELLDVMETLNPEASRKQLKATVLEVTYERADEIAHWFSIDHLIPPEIGTLFSDYMGLLKLVVWMGVIACLVMGGLVYACRRYRFGGFMWLSVNTGLASLWMLILVVLMKLPIWGSLLAGNDTAAALLNAIASSAGNVLMNSVWAMLALTVVFAGVFVLLKYTVLKKKDAAESADSPAPYAPVPQPYYVPAAEAPVTGAEESAVAAVDNTPIEEDAP